jgi:YbbR domain-containing protein
MARKEKQELMIIVLSMFLAFLLWTYVMAEQSPEHVRVIQNIPVKFLNEESLKQSDLALVPDQKVVVNLSVKGQGISVFNVTAEQIVIEADLSGYALKKGKNTIPYRVKSLPTGIRLEDANLYSYVSIELDAFIEKTVPVNISVSGDVKEGYGYISPVTLPTEVVVSGPERYINSVTAVQGLVEIANTTTKDLTPYIHVKPQGRDGKAVSFVEVEPKYVKVVIAVKPAKKVPIALKTTGKMPGDKILRGMKPGLESVTIIGDAAIIDKISELQTIPVDLSKINSTATREIFLNIPTGVTVAGDFKSINVDFTVENKVDKTFSVNITSTNPQDGFNYEINPKSISVTLTGAESVINTLDVKNIAAVIDLKDLTEGTNEVAVKVTIPEGTDNMRVSTEKVNVAVTKK